MKAMTAISSMKRTLFLVSVLALLVSWFPLNSQAQERRTVLSAERVVQALRDYVLQQSPWQGSQVEVDLRAFSSVRLPSHAEPVSIRVLRPRSGITPGPRRFFIAVRAGQHEIKRTWVQAEVRVFDHVVVTSRPLANHESFTSDNVRIERRELRSLAVRALTALDDVLGKQAGHMIPINEIVTASMVKQPRVVRRGGGITMLFETGELRIAARGKALQPGSVGDVIQVKNASSGKVLEGQILDAHTVRINW